MKTLLYLTLGTLLACPILSHAQSTNDAPPGPPPGGEEGGPGGGHHHGMDFLTADQKAEYQKDRQAALAADPSLASQFKSLREQMKEAHDSGEKPNPDLFQQMKTLQDQLDAAMIKLDPSVASIIEEIKAHHPKHGPGQGGPEGQSGQGGGSQPPPPDSGT